MRDAADTRENLVRPLWRNRDYLLLWSGQAVSVTGTVAATIAFPLLVLALTGSPLQAGLVGALGRIPFLILGLPAGALIDRWNRKLVMILADASRALAYATIPLAMATGHLTIALIYVVVLIDGLGFAFFNLAEVSALPQVVHTSQISQATAYNQVMWAAGSVAGPPLGGLLYAVNRALPFLVNAISYAASVVSLFAIRRPFQGERPAEAGSLWQEVKEGLVWLWHYRLMRLLAFLTGGLNLVFGGAPLVVIILSRQTFHASPGAIGVVFGAASVGGVVGALLGGWLQQRLTLPQAILGGLWSGAVLYPLLAIGPNLLFITVVAALLFLTSPVFDIAQFSYRVSRIPDQLQGRVNSVYRIILFAGEPLGQLAGGALAQSFGPRVALGCMAAGMVVIALVATFSREVRQARR